MKTLWKSSKAANELLQQALAEECHAPVA